MVIIPWSLSFKVCGNYGRAPNSRTARTWTSMEWRSSDIASCPTTFT
jgi:hypothetical protein